MKNLNVNIIYSVWSFSHVQFFATPWTAAHQASLPLTNSRSSLKLIPSSWWCHPTISSSVIPFFHRQSLSASGSFQMSQLFTSGGQSIGASTSASVLSIQDWSPLGLTNLISLQSKGLLRVFPNTTVQKHQFFSAQLSLWSNSRIHTWWLEKPWLWRYGHLSTKWCLYFNTLSRFLTAFFSSTSIF